MLAGRLADGVFLSRPQANLFGRFGHQFPWSTRLMIADDLSRIAMSASLAGSLSRATDYARTHGHTEVTLEHMLLALCDDPDAVLVLAASNVNVAELVDHVGGQLSVLQQQPIPGQGSELVVAPDLRRILEAAAAAARGGRRREINGAIVLAAIVGDGKSAAAHVLRNLGMTFEGAIRALQKAQEPRPPAPDAEAILASARERVQSRTGPPVRRLHATEEHEQEEDAHMVGRALPAPTNEEEFAPPAVEPEPEPQHSHEAEPEYAPAPAYEPGPEPETHPSYEHEPQLDDRQFAGGYGERDGAEQLPQQRPASAPFPPPIPVPDAAGNWTPPPSPPPQGGARAFPTPPPPSLPPIPPAPAPAARPGPPPLAPWPDASAARRPPGVGTGSVERPAAYDAMVPDDRFRLGRRPPPQTGSPRSLARPAPAPRAEIGQLVENIPRAMRVAVPALIEVRIARADVQALSEGLQGGGAAYHHEVTVTKAMSVRLRAPDGGFFIETASPETQWIEKTSLLSSDDFASWRWHVTPREKGRRRLQLIISARTVSADGLAAETALPDQVITVRVRTNYAKAAVRWVGWGAAAVIGGLLAKFGEGAFDSGMQALSKFIGG
jgi:hypothetical protein